MLRLNPQARTSAGAFFAPVLLALVLIAAPHTARAQAEPGPLHTKPGTKPEVLTPEQEKNAIRVRVNEVTAPVTVRDPKGEMVLDLTKDSFHVFDNGAEQKIDHFDLGGDPLSIVLVLETSSHLEPMMPAIRRTGVIFTQTVMGLTSEAAVVGFDDSVDLLHKFTTDPDAVEHVFSSFRMGTMGVHLYDGMWRAISMLEERPAARRRIMVVMAEAQDDGSDKKLGEVLRKAQLANVTIYSIGLSTTMADLRAKPRETVPRYGPPGTYPLPTPPGHPQTPELEAQMAGVDFTPLIIWLVKTGKNAILPNSLAVASKATGGLHLNTLKDRSIEKALDEIGGELHAQYTLAYRPPGEEPSGFHKIEVTVDRAGLSVRTRPGYYLAPPETD
jgi:VWFA-related protein